MYLVPLDGKIPLGQSIFSQKGKDDEVDEAPGHSFLQGNPPPANASSLITTR